MEDSSETRLTKEELKQWFKSTGRPKRWLAHELGLSDASVEGLLYSKRPIPACTELKLRELMRRYGRAPENRDVNMPKREGRHNHTKLDLRFVTMILPEDTLYIESLREEFDAWWQAAAKQGYQVEEWARDVLNKAAREFLKADSPAE